MRYELTRPVTKSGYSDYLTILVYTATFIGYDNTKRTDNMTV